MVQTAIKWDEFKSFIDNTKLEHYLNYLKLITDNFYVWFTYQGITFYVVLQKGTVGYEDFFNNYKDKAILKNDINSIDGLPKTHAHKVTQGRYLQGLFVQIKTATKELNDVTGSFSVTLYDKNGAITEDSNIAVKTKVRFAPGYSYEIYAGGIQTLEDVTDDIYVSSTIAPDVPVEHGGSIVNILNKKILKPKDDYLIVGTGPAELAYDESSPVKANIIDIEFKHDEGVKVEFQVQLQIYA